jgi:Ni/Fe-hydrogenase subunit HybB-like protein
MLIAGPKIHPLWHTALLPTLFLISCLSMGYGSVVVLVNILRVTWNAKQDQKLFAEMSKVNAALLFLYVVLRVADLAFHGKFRFFRLDFPTFLFLFEMALFLVPAFMFFSPKVQKNEGRLFGAALLTIAAGAFYRVDTYLAVYRPVGWMANGDPYPAGWNYFPSLGETLVTVGMAAVGIAIFLFISRKFPVVVVEEARTTSTLAGAKHAASR